MATLRSTPDHCLVVDAWQDMLSRGMQMFAYYHCWSLEKKNPTLPEDTTWITVRNAALESSLMAIRDLDDFFSRSNPRADDMHASDYSYPACQSVLTPAERDSINKKLAHLTYQSAQERLADPLCQNPRTWNNAVLVGKAVARLLDFLDHLEYRFLSNDTIQVGFIRIARSAIQLTARNIANVAKLEMDFTA